MFPLLIYHVNLRGYGSSCFFTSSGMNGAVCVCHKRGESIVMCWDENMSLKKQMFALLIHHANLRGCGISCFFTSSGMNGAVCVCHKRGESIVMCWDENMSLKKQMFALLIHHANLRGCGISCFFTSSGMNGPVCVCHKSGESIVMRWDESMSLKKTCFHYWSTMLIYEDTEAVASSPHLAWTVLCVCHKSGESIVNRWDESMSLKKICFHYWSTMLTYEDTEAVASSPHLAWTVLCVCHKSGESIVNRWDESMSLKKICFHYWSTMLTYEDTEAVASSPHLAWMELCVCGGEKIGCEHNVQWCLSAVRAHLWMVALLIHANLRA